MSQKGRVLSVGAALSAALALAGCGSGVSGSTSTTAAAPTSGPDSAGISSSTITLGNVSTTGGPVPGLFLGAQVGLQAYVDYLNSTGGLDGRKLSVMDEDDELNCTNNKNDTIALEPHVLAYVGQFSLFDNCGGTVIPATIANVSNPLNPVVTKLPNTFAPQPILNGWATGTLLWLKKNYPSDVDKVGALVGNVPTVETSWEAEANALKQTGFTVVDVEKYDVGQAQLQPEVTAMKNSGVKIVLLDQADVGGIADFLVQSEQLGFHPAVFFNSGSAYDGSFVTRAAGAASNIIVALHESLYLGQDASAVPAVGLFNHWVQVAHPGFSPDIYTMFAWASAELFAQAAKAAGASLSRATLLAQLKKITSFDADGLIAPDNPAGKVPPNCFLVAHVVNGEWQRIEPSSGFECSGTYIYDNSIP